LTSFISIRIDRPCWDRNVEWWWEYDAGGWWTGSEEESAITPEAEQSLSRIIRRIDIVDGDLVAWSKDEISFSLRPIDEHWSTSSSPAACACPCTVLLEESESIIVSPTSDASTGVLAAVSTELVSSSSPPQQGAFLDLIADRRDAPI
jgi:hypothetical protein